MRQFRFRDTQDLAVIDAEDTLRFLPGRQGQRRERVLGQGGVADPFVRRALTANEVAALACGEIPSTLRGTVGDITGTAADEVIIAGAGDDTLGRGRSATVAPTGHGGSANPGFVQERSSSTVVEMPRCSASDVSPAQRISATTASKGP